MAEPDIFKIMRMRAEGKQVGSASPSPLPPPRREDALHAEPISSVPPPPPPKNKGKRVDLGKTSMQGNSSQPQGSKRERSEKSRHGKGGSEKKRKRFGSYSAEPGFMPKNFQEYNADPLEVAIHVFRHFTDLAQRPKDEAEARIKAAEKEKELAQANLKKAQAEAKKDGEKISALEKEVAKVKKERNEIDQSRMTAHQRVTELEFQLKTSEAAKAEADKKISELEVQIEDLKSQLQTSGGQGGDSALQARIKQLEDEVAETAKFGMEMANLGFARALEQAKVLCPDFHAEPQYLDPKFKVVEGKIVHVVNGVQTVVYPPEVQDV